MHRFFVAPSCFEEQQVRLTGDQAHQICHVLRLQPGQGIVVLDGRGEEWELSLLQVGAKEVVGEIRERRRAQGEPVTQIMLLQSLLKRDKFEWVLQKATEVGVSMIVPVITARALVRDKGPFKPGRVARWRRILTEAAEQSHRGRIPTLVEPVTLIEGLRMAEQTDRSLMACPQTESSSLCTCLKDIPRAASLAMFIGPEGGFTPEEINQARQARTLPINLGPRILRTETAAIVAVSLLLYERGEFGCPNPIHEP